MRIQAARRLLADRAVHSLHNSADCLERAARLDHPGAFALTRESRPRLWLSSGRGALVSGSALHRVFAPAVSRVSVGCDRKLAPDKSSIQNLVPDVVWLASVCFLFAPVA